MKQYDVKGMSCAACSSKVEKAVSAVEGVTSCSVNLLTNSMNVEGTAENSEIFAAVEKAGYSASLKGASKSMEKTKENDEFSVMKRRFITSLFFLIILMYFSMGNMLGLPLPSYFSDNPLSLGLIELYLSAIILVINQKFFLNGIKGVIHKAPNMDTLVALGMSASFIYSTYALFAMSDSISKGDTMGAYHYIHEFYFESAAMIPTLITLGKMLEARSKGKTTDAIKKLIDLTPKTAIVIRNGVEAEIPADEIRKGDIFIVKAGESIPADGIVTEGVGAVNESALTGESLPVDKIIGDKVSAATINTSGYLKCEAVGVGEETGIAKIIRMVSEAASTKAPIAKLADKVSGVFVPVVIAIAAITTLIWLLIGEGVGYALGRGISVLVISCPCALGLATPVAIMVGSGVGAKNGILFKTAVSLEETGKARIVVLDKTGTITKGQPVVTDVIAADGADKGILLSTAVSLEAKSSHPLALAITAYAKENNTEAEEINNFVSLSGNGLTAEMDGVKILGGKSSFVGSMLNIPGNMKTKAECLANEGKTPLFFGKGDSFLGIIAIADAIKEDSINAVTRLKNMGMRVVMLTGDNRRTAEAIAIQAGITEIVSDVLPDGKASEVNRLKKEGKVIMVGDGINDAPALTAADIGIAIGAGTDIAIESADAVLMKSCLSDIPAAISLSRSVLRNIRQNLFWAFFYNALGIPLAAGAFVGITGWTLSPMFGAAAMSLSSFCVVTNALRLNLVDVYNPMRDKIIKQKHRKNEVKTMEITMKIEGMMCGHCEATVKKALEAIDSVEEAIVSHEKGTAIVKLNKETDFEVLKKAVEDKDYKVIE